MVRCHVCNARWETVDLQSFARAHDITVSDVRARFARMGCRTFGIRHETRAAAIHRDVATIVASVDNGVAPDAGNAFGMLD